MNVGVQHELHPGTVLTVDYMRNVMTHTLLGIDANHVGDAKYFNMGAAQAAIKATLAQCGVSTVAAGLAGPCPSGALAGQTLTIEDFAANGLGDPGLVGGSCAAVGMGANGGCAFGGINPNAGEVPLMEPIGRSVYNAMDVKLTQQVSNPMPGIKHANLQVAYSLSRFVNPGGAGPAGATMNSDQDFVLQALDNDNPLSRMGPSLLDRTNQLSFGGYADLPFGFRGGFIGHFYTGLPISLEVANTGAGAAEIFLTDFTGDGTVSDLVPGTNIGAFNRSISTVAGLDQVITNYNNTAANQPTPAGQVLINNGLFTLAQLQQLGGVAPSISMPPSGEVGVGGLRAFDFTLSWVHKFRERFQVEPSVGFYNLFNFTNYDLPPNVISGLLNGAAGSLNGTTQGDRISNRVGAGTGVFTLGAPRAIEFGMRFSF
jgi:hypothetical protein